MIGEVLRRLRFYFHRRQFEEDLEEEMSHHLALAGKKQFGNVTLLKEDSRAMWTWTFWEQLSQDLRYALRTMNGNRAFTALVVLSLGLGIGANSAIYSFMDSILLRSLPVSDPNSLVVLNWQAKKAAWGSFVMHAISGRTYEDPKAGTTAGIFPYPAFELFRSQESIFSSVFSYFPAPNLNVTIKGQADVSYGEFVSGDYFRGLAVPPAAGRLITPDDDRFGALPAAVISFAMSQRRFGGPEKAAGQTMLINNRAFVVAGVAAPGFFGVDPARAPDLYLPMHADVSPESDARADLRAGDFFDQHFYWIEVMGRLRPGVSMAQARAVLGPAFEKWVADTATSDAERANLPWLTLQPGAGGLDSLRRMYSQPLYVLMGLVGLILAVACANVANLLLARASARRREIALRLSVGAGRFRVIRQLLTESVLMASIGGAVGVLFAVWGIRFLRVLLVNGSRNLTLNADLNWHVVAMAAALSLLTGALFGLAPALQSTRVDVISAMKETRAGQVAGRPVFKHLSLGQLLVVGQIAASLLMLVAAGLFVRTLTNLESMEVGFNRQNLLLFSLDARKAGHKDPEITAFYGDLLKKFRAIPGVREASLSNQPLIEAGYGLGLLIHGKRAPGPNRMLVAGPDFFETMQIPLVEGRGILESDLPSTQAVAVASEYFVKLNFGDDNPIGQHVTIQARPGSKAPPRDMVIVGIAKNVRYGGLRDRARPVLYIPYNQGYPYPNELYFELRTSGNPLRYASSVREIVHEADPLVPVAGMMTQVEEIDRTINQEIVFAELCTGFALLALIIACVGLYGTVSYSVSRRTSEIGIRMALGARRGDVVRMILGQVVVMAAAGLAIGVPVALGASKLVASFLFEMKANDPRAIAAAVMILAGAALIAGYAPARRAARIEPMAALRNE